MIIMAQLDMVIRSVLLMALVIRQADIDMVLAITAKDMATEGMVTAGNP